MTGRKKFEDVIIKSAQSADFMMEDAHWQSTLQMIRAKKKARIRNYWILGSLIVFLAFSGLYVTSQWDTKGKEGRIEKESVDRIPLEMASGNAGEQARQGMKVSSNDTDSGGIIATKDRQNMEKEPDVEGVLSARQKSTRVDHQQRTQSTEEATIASVASSARGGMDRVEEGGRQFEDRVTALRDVVAPPADLEELEISSFPASYDNHSLTRPLMRTRAWWEGWRLHLFTVVDFYQAHRPDVEMHGIELGIHLRKNWAHYFVGFEPSVEWTRNSDADFAIHRVDDYGLEVGRRYFKVSTPHVLNANVLLLGGGQWRKWESYLGVGIGFFPMGWGRIDQVDNTDGVWRSSSTLGEGRIDPSNTTAYVWKGKWGVGYHWTTLSTIGIELEYRHNAFYMKNEIRDMSLSSIRWGVRIQHKF